MADRIEQKYQMRIADFVLGASMNMKDRYELEKVEGSRR